MEDPQGSKAERIAYAKVADEFTKLYYQALDTRRSNLINLYLSDTTFSFNGNRVSGAKEVVAFLESLPVSNHQVESLTCQSVSDQLVGKNRKTLLITAGGLATFGPKGEQDKTRSFGQNFILTAQDKQTSLGGFKGQQSWKIVSDTYRFQDC